MENGGHSGEMLYLVESAVLMLVFLFRSGDLAVLCWFRCLVDR